MEELKAEEERLGFRLLLIDAKGMLNKTREIVDEKEVTIPLLIDSRGFARNRLNAMYTPTTFIIDEKGRLRARLVGGSEDFVKVVTDLLEKL
jgi:peroxiredoxin